MFTTYLDLLIEFTNCACLFSVWDNKLETINWCICQTVIWFSIFFSTWISRTQILLLIHHPPIVGAECREVERRRGNRSSRYGEACCHRYFCGACALPSSFLLFLNEYLCLTHLCPWQIRNISFSLSFPLLLLHPLPLRYFGDDPRFGVAAHLSSLTCRSNFPPLRAKRGEKEGKKKTKKRKRSDTLLSLPPCLASLTCVAPFPRSGSVSRAQNAEGLSGEEGERFARKAELERAARPRARGRLHPRWVSAPTLLPFFRPRWWRVFTHGKVAGIRAFGDQRGNVAGGGGGSEGGRGLWGNGARG